MTTAGFTPTDEQELAIKLFATGEDLAIEAGAGTGKSSTLRLLAQQAETEGRSGIYVAFNKALVTDFAASAPGNVTCSTAHSLAYRAHGYRYAKRLKAGRMKSMEIARILDLDPFTVTYGTQRRVLATGYLAGLTMRAIENFCQSADPEPVEAHVPYIDGIDVPTEGPDGPRRGWANNREVRTVVLPAMRRAWVDLCRLDGRLQYKHSHYLKQYELSAPHIAADFILVDEAQDISPVLYSIISRQTHAQIVWVGDSAQAIYGFTGAVDALARITAGGGQRSQLSQSFRFGHEVAAVANGLLGRLGSTLQLRGFGNVSSVVGPVPEPSAILTRTNVEAIKQLLAALADDRHPHLVGGGAEVTAFVRGAQDLMQRGWTSHPELACFQSWGEVQEYVDSDANGSELKLMVDLIDSFGCEVILSALDRAATEVGADLIISTAHKAKGREWDSVQLAGDFFKPKGEDDVSADELRLLYVAVTRAKLELDATAVPHALGLGATEIAAAPTSPALAPAPAAPPPPAPAARSASRETSPSTVSRTTTLHSVTLRNGVTYHSRFLGRCEQCGTTARLEVPASQPLPGRWVMAPPSHHCEVCHRPVAVQAVVGTLTEGRCDPRCWNAYGSDCHCSCGGRYHGDGHGPLPERFGGSAA